MGWEHSLPPICADSKPPSIWVRVRDNGTVKVKDVTICHQLIIII